MRKKYILLATVVSSISGIAIQCYPNIVTAILVPVSCYGVGLFVGGETVREVVNKYIK